MTTRARYLFLVAVAGAVLVADQVSKAVVAATLAGSPPLTILGGLVELVDERNSGAAFSILQSGGYLFEAVALIVAVAILVAYPRIAGRSLLLRTGNALLLGGALGNLLDRIRHGYVTDFIDLRWWPVFNLADSAIVIGVALLVLHSLLQETSRAPAHGPGQTDASEQS